MVDGRRDYAAAWLLGDNMQMAPPGLGAQLGVLFAYEVDGWPGARGPWRHIDLDALRARARDLGIRPATAPTLVAIPVRCGRSLLRCCVDARPRRAADMAVDVGLSRTPRRGVPPGPGVTPTPRTGCVSCADPAPWSRPAATYSLTLDPPADGI